MQSLPAAIPVVAALIILSIWYFIFWSMGLIFSRTYDRDKLEALPG